MKVWVVTYEDYDEQPQAVCASIEDAQNFVRPMIKAPEGATDITWHTRESTSQYDTRGSVFFGISYLKESPHMPWLNSHRWSIDWRFEPFEVIGAEISVSKE